LATCNDPPNASCDTTCGDDVVSFYREYHDGDYRVIESNNVPNTPYHEDIENQNPNAVCEHKM